MRDHLKAARVKVQNTDEPATLERTKEKLRAVGVYLSEVEVAVGMPLDRYLHANQKLPLWAALALILEATGRFTPAQGRGR